MNEKLIELNIVELAQLLDIARFQRMMAQQKLAHHQATEGPMADYNWNLYSKNEHEFSSAVKFWSAIEKKCEAPIEVDLAKLKADAAVDGPIFNLGRSEGWSDVSVRLRKILDPNDDLHLSLDGLLGAVRGIFWSMERMQR